MNPNAVADIFASEVVSGFDLHKPEKLKTLFRPFGDQGRSHFMMLKEFMFEKPVAAETFSHFELKRYHDTFKVRTAVADPTAGVDLVLTLSTDNMDAENRFYPRRFDSVMLKNEVTGLIWDIDTSTPADPVITIKLNDNTDNFQAVGTGDEIIIISGAFSEGSGQPGSTISGTTERSNDMQIIKETIGFTGTEITNQTWLKLAGTDFNSYWWEGQAQLDYKMMLKIDGALTFQKRTINPTMIDPDTKRKILTTEGSYQYARRRANPFPKASGAWDVPDFDAVDLTLEANHVGNYICVQSGPTRYQNIENAMKAYHNDTNIAYARETASTDLYGGRPSKDSVINFKYFTKSGRTYMLKRNSNFANPKTYGATNFEMTDWSLFHSLNKFVESGTGKRIEEMGMRYKKLGAYNRRMEVWSVGGAGLGPKVNQFDARDTFQRAHIGSQNANGEKWALVTVS
ncbi:MAG: hypothetical protein ACI9DM_000252 [Cyclobacteriaceae bacterium]|jgi:hypothetical protein